MSIVDAVAADNHLACCCGRCCTPANTHTMRWVITIVTITFDLNRRCHVCTRFQKSWFYASVSCDLGYTGINQNLSIPVSIVAKFFWCVSRHFIENHRAFWNFPTEVWSKFQKMDPDKSSVPASKSSVNDSFHHPSGYHTMSVPTSVT